MQTTASTIRGLVASSSSCGASGIRAALHRAAPEVCGAAHRRDVRIRPLRDLIGAERTAALIQDRDDLGTARRHRPLRGARSLRGARILHRAAPLVRAVAYRLEIGAGALGDLLGAEAA